MARLIDEFRSQGRRRRVPIGGKRGPELTTRQWEVLELMGEGYTTTEIGRRLDVSPTTVRRHVSDILAKLGVSDRREAIALFSDEPALGRPLPSRGPCAGSRSHSFSSSCSQLPLTRRTTPRATPPGAS